MRYATICLVMSKWILCQTFEKDKIAHQLFKESKSNGLTDLHFVSLRQLLLPAQKEDSYLLLLQTKRLLEKNQKQFPIYNQMFQYTDFIEELISFAKECILYEITPDDLPTDTPLEKELKEILKLLLELPFEEKEIIQNRNHKPEEAYQYENLQVYPHFETNYFFDQFLQELIENHPSIEVLHSGLKPSSIAYHYALSSRQEIEAMAQEICKQKKPSNVVLCNYNEQLPIVKQVFARYQIPFEVIRDHAYLTTPQRYIALVEFGLHKDVESLLNALKKNAFSSKVSYETITNIEHYILDIKELENREELIDIKEEYESLLQEKDPKQVLVKAFEFLQAQASSFNKNEIEALLQIRKILNQTFLEIKDQNDLDFILNLIQYISASLPQENTDFCMITDLTHPTLAKDVTYVLGCSGRDYPGIPKRTGLFDEAYVRKIEKYPSYQLRHQRYMEQLAWIQESCTELVYSRSTNDYQGREIQPSFVLDSLNVPLTSWELLHPYAKKPKKHTLSFDTAKNLFLQKDGTIHGSISRIERWFGCPYSYYLQSGLKIQPQTIVQVDAASIGSLQHEVLEKLINQYGNDYVKATQETIEQLVEPTFNELLENNPKDHTQIQITKERLVTNILVSLSHLKEVEENTLFKPKLTEYYFDSNYFPGISLHGIIDRIDEVNGAFRVVDYKSSHKTLEVSKFCAGLQLQLITYLVVYEVEQNLKPTGAYYYSLQQKNINHKANTSSRAKGFTLDQDNEESILKEFRKLQRLSGWTFEDHHDLYDNFAQYYTPGKRPWYDYEAVKECLKELYEFFQTGLLEGNIDVNPVENACTFCDYLTVCRHQLGQGSAMLIHDPNDLKQGGDSE